MRLAKSVLMLCLFCVLAHCGLMAQKKSLESVIPDKTRVLLILDCSNSMWDKWQSDSKIKITQTVLLKFLDSISNQNEIDVALRVFGHLNKNSYGTRLEVPFEKDNIYKLRSKIKTLVPQGGCEVASALSHSLNDFPSTGNSRNIVLIITDGMDDCEGTICEVAKQVQNSGVIVKTFVLGIGDKKNFQSNLNCAGKFIHVPQEEQYTQSLYDIFTLSEEKANVRIQVKDFSGMSYETSMPIVFYDAQTGLAKYQVIYSSDNKDGEDIITIDPLVAYNVKAYTNPPMVKNNVLFDYNKTNDLVYKVEQGFLNVRYEAKRTTYQVPEYPIVVRKRGEKDIVNIQKVNEKVPYQAGRYDVVILSTPYIELNDVAVNHVSNTDLAIPTPGAASIAKPKTITRGTLFAINGADWQYVCNLDSGKVSERILLMPGEYVVVLKPIATFTNEPIMVQKFRIDAGLTTTVQIK